MDTDISNSTISGITVSLIFSDIIDTTIGTSSYPCVLIPYEPNTTYTIVVKYKGNDVFMYKVNSDDGDLSWLKEYDFTIYD